MCGEVNHRAKEYPHYIFKASHISFVRGRGTTKVSRGRGSGVRGAARVSTQTH